MPTPRSKSISTKVTEEEYSQFETLAGEQTISEWVRDALLKAAKPSPAEQTIVAELLALRMILMNILFTIANREPLTSTAMNDPWYGSSCGSPPPACPEDQGGGADGPGSVTPTITVQGNPYGSIFVGTDPNLAAANSIFATVSPSGGTFTETSSVSGDTFTPVQSGGPGWVVGTTTQSTTAGDRKLTFAYTLNNVPASQSLNVTARQFAYATNNSPSNTCTGYGTTQVYTYTPYTHPDKTAVQGGNNLSGTAVTESFNPQPPAGTVTGSGALNTDAQFTDTLEYCSNSPLTISTTVTQTLSIEGYQVRQNTLKYSSTGITYTSLGPTQ